MILLLISFIIKKKNSPFHPGRGFFLNGSLQAAFFEHAVLPDIQPENADTNLHGTVCSCIQKPYEKGIEA